MANEGKPQSAWLADEMKQVGMANQTLFQLLVDSGWKGTLNNVSNWKSGQSLIPAELIPRVVKALGKDPHSGEGLADVIHLLRQRFPDLSPWFREAPARITRSNSRQLRPVYIGRRGLFQGQRFVPYRDAEGNYVAGTSRFEKDKQLFTSEKSLVAALKANPMLRVRMVPEGELRSAPSLIHQDSIIWE